MDPKGTKSKLSIFANSVYDQLWFKRGGPKNIHIVNFEIGSDDSKYLKEIIFGLSSDRQYDGIHLRGNGHSRHFTYRAIQAIRPAIVSRPATNYTRPLPNYHANCPQTQYQHQSKVSSKQGYTEQFTFPTKFKKSQIHPSTRSKQEEECQSAGTRHFTRGKVSSAQYTSFNVNVANRFNQFNPLGKEF